MNTENYKIYDLRIPVNHKDLLVLADELDSIGLEFTKETIKTYDADGTPHWNDTKFPELRGCGVSFNGGSTGFEKGNPDAHSKDGHYIKTPRIFGWNEADANDVKDALVLASEKTSEYDFIFHDTTDYEEDPGERSWDASFNFFCMEKGLPLEKQPELIHPSTPNKPNKCQS